MIPLIKTFIIAFSITFALAPHLAEADKKGSGQITSFSSVEGIAKAQHGGTKAAIANLISADTGRTLGEVEDYSARLADVLGQLDEAALKRVLKDKVTTLQ